MKIIYFIITISIVVILASCGLGENEFDEALSNMENVESFRIDIKMEDVPLFGTMTGYILIDGEYEYSSFFGTEDYKFTIENNEYNLVVIGDEYYAIEVIVDSDDEDVNENIYEEFSADNFTKNDEGYYVSSINYDEMSNVRVKIENGYITELNANLDLDGYLVSVTFEFSGYNSTEIDFPDYQVMTYIETIIFELSEEGYTYIETETGFRLEDWSDTIEYIDGNDYFSISSWLDEVKFYPVENSIVEGQNNQSLDDYLLNTYSPVLDSEVFDLLSELFGEID